MAQTVPETLLPGVIDHHVHLGLVDVAQLAGGPVVEVHDLGWSPEQRLSWRRVPPPGVRVRVAGPFHTAPGGYPTGRTWAPSDAVRPVDSPASAREAVRVAVQNAYDALKITLRSGMPLLPDDALRALTVPVHAEGLGQAAHAIDAGADVLMHAPWTEYVRDDELGTRLIRTWDEHWLDLSLTPSPSMPPKSSSHPWESRCDHPRDQPSAVVTTLERPAMSQVLALRWAEEICPDFRHSHGLRIGLSPLSTPFSEVARALLRINNLLPAT